MPYDQIIHIDFETYFDKEYSLRKMSTINYVRDPRFETLGVSVAVDDGDHLFMSRDEFIEWASDIDWSRSAVNAFNCEFDATVLTQRYDIFPAMYIDPLSAARGLIPHLRSYSLKVLAPLLGVGEKGDALVSGSREVGSDMVDYANNDNELSRRLYKLLYPMLPEKEQRLISWTIRAAAEPTLELDSDVLIQVRDDAVREREEKIKASGYSATVLGSNPKFKALVESLGLTAPTKISKTTGEEAEAFAKGDDEFVSFMLDNPEYKHVWEGRLAAKSNINIKRAEKFIEVAVYGDTMPMPLNYCGAGTGRWSGAQGFNVQNLPNLYKSNLRKALVAPRGYKLVVADLSQIELRLNMWFAGQYDKLDLLRSGGDIYIAEAAAQYGIPENEVTKMQRQFGKVVQLGAGFYMGANAFRKYCAAGPLGMDPIYLTEAEAATSIRTYRRENYMVEAQWKFLGSMIPVMATEGANHEHKCVTFIHQGIRLPSGRLIQYPNLRFEHRDGDEYGSWVYGFGKDTKFLHGGIIDENIVQALARDVMGDKLLEIDERYRVVSSTHDEAIYLALEDEADEALQFGLSVMSVSPDWAPDLPLSAEGDHDYCYSK
jgi:DNA polymerase